MALPKEIKSAAFNLFIQGNDAVEILDKISDLRPTTLYGWIKNENWKQQRERRLLNQQSAGDILLSNLEKLIQRIEGIISDLETPRDDMTPAELLKFSEAQANQIAKFSDAISKISKVINTVAKDRDRLSQILFSFGEFKIYISQNRKNYKHDFMQELDQVLKGFQNQMLTKFGNG